MEEERSEHFRDIQKSDGESMKAALVSTWNIENNYTAVPHLVYEYAKFLVENGVDAELLIPKTREHPPKVRNYKALRKRYSIIPQRVVDRKVVRIPQWHAVYFKDLPTDSVIYFSNSIYDSIMNIVTKPRGQPYIISSHNMFITKGSTSHETFKRMRNNLVNTMLSMKGKDIENVYFHVINKAQERTLMQVFHIKKSKIFYVPNLIDSENYKIGKNKSKKLRVLHVGGSIKNMHIVLEIIKRLKERKQLDNFEFYFIGREMEHLEEYKKFSNVHVLGPVSDKEKYKALSEMDAMIVPGIESFSVAMVEGLASGLHVLTSKRTTTWEDMRDFGIKMDVTEHGTANEYVGPLERLAKLKCSGKEFNPRRAANWAIALKEFDKGSVLPKILDMFTTAGKGLKRQSSA